MPTSLHSLPPLATLAAALVTTTRTLAAELVQPSVISPQWSESEWRTAQAVVAMHGIGTLLHGRLRWIGPDHWQAFLAEQARQTALRHEKIVALVQALDERLRTRGIAAVALKGAALHALDLYRAGERPMGDIDLLLRPAEFAAVAEICHDLGFAKILQTSRETTFATPNARAHTLLGEHADNPIKIELHVRVFERLPIKDVEITAQIRGARAAAGIVGYASHAALLAHLLLHATGNMRARALRMIQLHDIALLGQRLQSADWQQLLSNTPLWWAFPAFALVARYYPAAIPPQVLRVVRDQSSPWLRRVGVRCELHEVSWSKIRIEAFPGIEWSRSFVDAAIFMRERLLPRREALTALTAGTASYGLQSVAPWYGLSHARRILKWITSRPPRVQTLQSLIASHATAQEPAT